VAFAGRAVETDVSPGGWVLAAVSGHPPGRALAALVPDVFAGHVRVFHPAYRYVGDVDVEVPWADVTVHNGTTAHPLMQWGPVTGAWEYRHEDSQPPLWDRAPDEGHLPTDVAARLVRVLRRHTTTPDDCWFGVRDGFGTTCSGAPVLPLPDREHWLLRGPVELATANLADEPAEQSATLWWPADRAWCVATDTDQMSTYVGGSTACVAELLAVPDLETATVRPGDPIAFDEDPVNPPPDDDPFG
jgi:hypothetical protein